jgi:low affinity Fe/Cu permease
LAVWFVAPLLAARGRLVDRPRHARDYGPRMGNHDAPVLKDRFNELADSITVALGSFAALAGSVLLVVIWALTGPIFGFSDSWQLFINTTTTVVTFWMVFVIQNSSNRSAKATQLKLDEVIRALESARNEIIGLDKATESTMKEREREFDLLASRSGPAKNRRAKGAD